jgi:hypothetical protein
MWEVYRLFLEKKPSGSSNKLFRIGHRELHILSTTTILGSFWIAEAEHKIFLVEEVYKQTVSLRLFPLPHGRDLASIPLVGTLCYALAARFRPAFKQKQIAGDCPSIAPACDDMTYCHAPEVSRTQLPTSYRVHGDEFVQFLYGEDSRAPPFQPSAPRSTRKSLSPPSPPNPNLTFAQSAHKTLAAAAATGFDTLECDPDQPHQLSPLGSDLR